MNVVEQARRELALEKKAEKVQEAKTVIRQIEILEEQLRELRKQIKGM